MFERLGNRTTCFQHCKWFFTGFFCRKDGNPFNTTVLPSPPLPSPPLLPPTSPRSEGPTSGAAPGSKTYGPSAQDGFQHKKLKESQVKKTTLIAATAMVLCLMVVLLIWSCWKYNRKVSMSEKISKTEKISTHRSHKEKPQSTEFLIQETNQVEKGNWFYLQFPIYLLS